MAEFGKHSTKCYILRNKDKCLIIDPSAESESIKNFVVHLYHPSKVDIFLTKSDDLHGGASKSLQDQFPTSTIYLSKANKNQLKLDEKNIKYVCQGDEIYVDDEKMTVIESGDSISLYAPESQVVFTGDSFREAKEKKQLKNLLELPQKTLVMPAHDEESSIRIELTKCE